MKVGECIMPSEEKPTIEIETLHSSEIAEASVLMSQAYNSEHITCAVFGGQSEKQRSLLESGFKTTLKKGTVFSAKENGKILGAMRFVEHPACKKEFLLQGLDLLPALLVLGSKALRVRKWESIWSNHHPDKAHCHLEAIGVLPERQGQGVGSLLLGYFCAYIDQRRQAAYLETGLLKNVHLYERFGFKVVEEASVLSVPNWFMWRDVVSSKMT